MDSDSDGEQRVSAVNHGVWEQTIWCIGWSKQYDVYNELQLKQELHDLTKAGLSLSAASKYLAKKNNLKKSIIYNMY